MTKREDELVLARVEDWRRRLIDLSYRNRLINFAATKSSTLMVEGPAVDRLLAEPDGGHSWGFFFPPEDETERGGEDGSSAERILADRMIGSTTRRAPLADEIVVSEQSPRRIARIVEGLARRSNAEFEDKALRILHVAAGFLEWIDPARNERLTSPLVMVPAELRRESARSPYRLHFVDDEEIVINPSLTEKLRRDAGLAIPEDWAWEDKPVKVELDEIRHAVAKNGWTVRDDAVIGLFSFQKYVMYRDLLDNEAAVTRHPVVRSLARKVADDDTLGGGDAAVLSPADLDELEPPDQARSILDADASQRLCIHAAVQGRSFVMHGPPGTGKSQTIANIIAETIGRGRSVLFVSEKAAALDVVYKRLTARGLSDYCLLLHGEHASRREVVDALHQSLTSELVPGSEMRPADRERLAQLRRILNDSAEILHLPMPLLGERSLRDVYADLSQLHGAPTVPGAPPASAVEGHAVSVEHQRLLEMFERLAERWRVSPRTFLWRGYDAERFSSEGRARVVAVVAELSAWAGMVQESGGSLAARIGWPAPANVRAARHVVLLADHLALRPAELEDHWMRHSGYGTDLATEIMNAEVGYQELRDTRQTLSAAYPNRRLADFPPDISERLTQAESNLAASIGRSSRWDDELIAGLPRLQAAVNDLPAMIASIVQRAEGVATLLGQPAENMTWRRTTRLLELADVAFQAENRPEQDWLVSAGRTRAATVLTETREVIADFQSRREDLFGSYQPTMLDVDLTGLRDRFTTRYSSFFARLSGDYRTDARTVKAQRRDQKLPPRAELVDQLNRLCDLRAIGEEIDAASERLSTALGSYASGRETSLPRVDAALAVADRISELAHPECRLDILASRVCVGSAASTELARESDRLRALVDGAAPHLDAVRFVAAEAERTIDTAPLTRVAEQLTAARDPLRTLADVRDHLCNGAEDAPATLPAIRDRVRMIGDTRAAEAHIHAHETSWRSKIGHGFSGEASDWNALRRAAEWLDELERLAGGAIPSEMQTRLASPSWTAPSGQDCSAACDRLVDAIARLAALFDADRATELTAQLNGQDLADVRQTCADLHAHVDDLHDWTEFRRWRNAVAKHGWEAFVDPLIDADITASEVTAAFRSAFWNRRLEAVFDDDPDLAEDFRAGTYQRWIDEFRKLDRRLVATGANRVIAKRNATRIDHVSTPGSEVALLRTEAGKKRRHLPVRKLLARLPALLSELKPCLMMSPLSVSHFLTADHHFDVVVFDEASQVPPQDAINCIYRGAQLIVAGDPHQLPPTPFFQLAEIDETAPDDPLEDTREDMESILDACAAILESHGLRWHYRSRHEHLIHFSNTNIYNGSLVTFPSPVERAEHLGVRFVHVPDGEYDRGRSSTNRREAKVVAARVVAHLKADAARSVGVIAFNIGQANAITEELEVLRLDHPELERHFSGTRLDAVFVKHLESVQGDERDVIIFSVGYGRDSTGRFTMNFGPLNKDGGHRRLNVAVTRARQLVEVVASVRSGAFDLAATAPRGAQLLRDYVAYAERGGEPAAPPKTADSAPADNEDRLIEAGIADAIAQDGYVTSLMVGNGAIRIDVGVRDPQNPDRFLLGVQSDGDSYVATPTARDRDRLREEALADLGWSTHRVWSVDWVRNRGEELNRLREALERGARGQRARRAPRDSGPDADAAPRRREREVVDLRDADDARDLPWVSTYRRCDLTAVPPALLEFHDPAAQRILVSVLEKLVQAEAPIHHDYAVKRLAESWGIRRTGHRVADAGTRAVGKLVQAGTVERRGEFLWRPGDTLNTVRMPDPNDERTRRDIDEIPPEEIDLAVRRLKEVTRGVPDEQLLVSVSRVLGFDRMGGRIREVLEQRLAAARPAIG